MKNANYYFTLFLVLFTTIFSFFHMFEIVQLSSKIISIVINNLLPSLLPFMILISLCLSLGLLHLLSYIIQYIFCPLFHLTPHMSSLYFISFFCGYPTNAKLIKESYKLGYINLYQLQHLLSIASFSSLSFIFISLDLPLSATLIIYISHITPSLIKALFYRHKYSYITIREALHPVLNPTHSFVYHLKNSITSSLYTFIFILGYMLVFQFISYSFDLFLADSKISLIISGLLEFSSASLLLSAQQSLYTYPLISLFISFSSLSVLMQIDNILEDIPYSFTSLLITRIIHSILSFFICFLLILLTFKIDIL